MQSGDCSAIRAARDARIGARDLRGPSMRSTCGKGDEMQPNAIMSAI